MARVRNEYVEVAGGWTLVIFGRWREERARIRIDASDVDRLRRQRWTWTAASKKGQPRAGYATSITRPRVSLHRFLLSSPEGLEVDHVNGDHADCRRENLRVVPGTGNRQNVVRNGRSGHRNVTYHPDRAEKGHKCYSARAGTKPNRIFRGYFATLEEAIEAAREIRAELFPYVNEARH